MTTPPSPTRSTGSSVHSQDSWHSLPEVRDQYAALDLRISSNGNVSLEPSERSLPDDLPELPAGTNLGMEVRIVDRRPGRDRTPKTVVIAPGNGQNGELGLWAHSKNAGQWVADYAMEHKWELIKGLADLAPNTIQGIGNILQSEEAAYRTTVAGLAAQFGKAAWDTLGSRNGANLYNMMFNRFKKREFDGVNFSMGVLRAVSGGLNLAATSIRDIEDRAVLNQVLNGLGNTAATVAAVAQVFHDINQKQSNVDIGTQMSNLNLESTYTDQATDTADMDDGQGYERFPAGTAVSSWEFTTPAIHTTTQLGESSAEGALGHYREAAEQSIPTAQDSNQPTWQELNPKTALAALRQMSSDDRKAVLASMSKKQVGEINRRQEHERRKYSTAGLREVAKAAAPRR